MGFLINEHVQQCLKLILHTKFELNQTKIATSRDVYTVVSKNSSTAFTMTSIREYSWDVSEKNSHDSIMNTQKLFPEIFETNIL